MMLLTLLLYLYDAENEVRNKERCLILSFYVSFRYRCCTSTLVYAFYVIALVFIVETGLFQFRLQNGGDYCVTSFAACAASDDVSFPTNGTVSILLQL